MKDKSMIWYSDALKQAAREGAKACEEVRIATKGREDMVIAYRGNHLKHIPYSLLDFKGRLLCASN